MTACPVVIFDACVLYPSTLRNLLMWLALTNLFRARWTRAIHEEWIKSVLADFPDIDPKSLLRTRSLMDENVPEALVTGYEPLIESLDLPDPDDRHVLAAAIEAGAGTIVTSNLRDFPAASLAAYRIEAVHPDDFVARRFDRDRDAVCNAAHEHRASLKNPPKTVAEYLGSLESVGLVQTAARLLDHRNAI